jgi:hypothetical protein
MSRGHLALAAERGELVPLPEFLERAWKILRDEPDADDEQEARPALFLIEGGGCSVPSSRTSLHVVPARRS